MYSDLSRSVSKDDIVDARNLVYYNNVDAEQTKIFAEGLISLKSNLPEGWNGVIAKDADCDYLLVSNFKGNTYAEVCGITCNDGAPVFYEQTTIKDNKANVTLNVQQNHSIAMPLKVYVKGSNVVAQLVDDESCYIKPSKNAKVSIVLGGYSKSNVSLRKGITYKFYIKDSEVCVLKMSDR